ncbi:MAG: hypothetical protein R3F56_17165 [Planctomycetota bacterium]
MFRGSPPASRLARALPVLVAWLAAGAGAQGSSGQAPARRSDSTPPTGNPVAGKPVAGKPTAGRAGQGAGRDDTLAPVVLQAYSEAASRHAFSAIDRNADDRIDIFEFTRSLDAKAGDSQDLTTFRHADDNRDGFLNWPEFDRRLRALLRLRAEFRYIPARRLAPVKTADTQVATPPMDARTKALWTLLDTDRSGSVSREEFVSMVTAAGMPPATMVRFVESDRNGDDQLDPGELTRLIAVLPGMPRTAPVASSSKGFSAAWRRADTDGDGEVSIAELQIALREHDIHLGRWADKIVADADRSGDRRLGPAEVIAAEPRR